MSDKGKASLPVQVDAKGIVLKNINDLFAFARLMVDGGFAPGHKNERSAAAAIAWGMQAGLTAVASLQFVAMINGRPSIWGKGVRALLLTSGKLADHKEWIEGEGMNRTAHCHLLRKGITSPFEGKFSMEDARRAGLLEKDSWKKYSDRMLQWRALGFAAADGFSDVLTGVMLVEEAQDLDPPTKDADVEILQEVPEMELSTSESDPPQDENTVREPLFESPKTSSSSGHSSTVARESPMVTLWATLRKRLDGDTIARILRTCDCESEDRMSEDQREVACALAQEYLDAASAVE